MKPHDLATRSRKLKDRRRLDPDGFLRKTFTLPIEDARAKAREILPEFQSGGDGLLFIVWDEGKHTDDRCSASSSNGCGGRIANLVIGPKVKRGFKSQVLYHHQSLMRTVCDAFGFSKCPGAAGSAPSMSDVF